MRIQHNISAMNALSKYTTNNNALSKNLQKLSSGFRINSAADDAAGLAVSEKMRSQIAGLEQAYNNTNDAISLIQTAEGALTEVNTMITRLKTLAVESSNGTYQDGVDRDNIQSEVEDILTEINRIADSTNFNSRKLLDGTLGKGGNSGSATGNITGTALADSLGTTNAVAGKFVYNAPSITAAVNTTYEFTLSYTDQSGNEKVKTVSYTTGGTVDANVTNQDGKKITLSGNAVGATLGEQACKDFAKDADIAANFTVTQASGAGTFEAKEKGTAGATITGFTFNTINSTGATTATTAVASNTSSFVAAKDSFNTYDVTSAVQWDPTSSSSKLEDAIFEVGGEKFVFIKNGTTMNDSIREKLSDAGVGNNYVVGSAATLVNTDAAAMAGIITAATGIAAAAGQKETTGSTWDPGSTGTLIGFKASSSGSSKGSGSGLILQVGDTNEEYEKIRLSVDDMHASNLGIQDIDLSSQEGALDAIAKINDAVNQVSAQRGKLGALQNRLEHAMNNLDTMTTNIQSSESQIRDTNMAKEMTQFTKNNILAQAAQSMLAQANSMPQGVLQLLQ